jgi:molybdenum cofactor cytidylyltransferase
MPVCGSRTSRPRSEALGYAAIVLAAGHGRRFGGDKLQALLHGRPLLDHAIDIAAAAPVDRIVVVSRSGVPVLARPRVEFVELTSNALSDTLKAGLREVLDSDGAFIFLGDMPQVPIHVAERLAGGIGNSLAAVPVHNGLPGHPVLLTRAGFALAEGLTGDEGLGRSLRGRQDVVRLPVDHPGVLTDVDTPADIAALQRSCTGEVDRT